MNPAFKFDIVGVDRYTAVANRINANVSKSLRPVRDLAASTRALGANVGIDKVAAGVGRLAGAAADAARRVASVATGVAGLVGLGSIAGVVALSNGLSRSALASENLATKLGVSVRELKTFEVAGRLVGLTAQQVDSSIESLGNTIEQAATGANVEAANYLRQLNIEITRLPNGSVDAIGALRQIADVVAKLPNAQARQAVAGAFGVADMLPLLMRGSAGIAELQRRAGGFANVLSGDALQAGRQYNEELVRFEESVDRLKTSLGMALMPAVTATAEAVRRLTDQYGSMMAAKVSEYVQGLAKWVRDTDWSRVGETFVKVGQAIEAAGPWIDKLTGMWNSEGAQRARTFVDNGQNLPKFDIKHPIDSARRMGQFYGGETVSPKGIGAGDWMSQLEQKHGLPAGILDAMWERESGRGKYMVSTAGALGHFGFMPGTAQEMGLADPNDFATSARAAAEYLARLRKLNGGDLNRALAAYNWGQGNLDRKGMAAAPKETQDYVAAIGGRFAAPAAGTGPSGAGQTVTGEVKVKVDLTGVPPQAKVVTSSSGDVKTTVNVGRSSLGYALP